MRQFQVFPDRSSSPPGNAGNPQPVAGKTFRDATGVL
jgi:hypothetical protein